MSNPTATEVVAILNDEMLSAVRDTAHDTRRRLVNNYIGDDRAELIASVDEVICFVEEEQAKRAGLASSADILASFPGAVVQDADHLAYLLDVDEDEKAPTENLTLEVLAAEALPRPENDSYTVGQRVICVNLPHIGATVRSLDSMGVGLDYDTDSDEERGTYEALYSAVRPMPLH